jgi:uncharacterized protein (TIGR02594 family)
LKLKYNTTMPTHRTTASVLRLREAPIDGAILNRLPRGTDLDLLQGPTKGWARVRANVSDGKSEGWVSMAHIAPLAALPIVVEPVWLPIARAEVGVKEYPGPQHNPRIIAYLKATTNAATTDETPWCSGFVNWCMKQAGVPRTNNAMARSWLTWGRKLSTPEHGCVVVFRRGTDPNSGHVAFFLEQRGTGIVVLGGNQSNSVCISSYPADQVVGYRTIEA